MSRPIGLSIVSAFTLNPFVIRRRQMVEHTVDILKRAGYDCMQLLPVRGLRSESIMDNLKWIFSREDAWNFGTLLQAIKRLLGRSGEDYPTWIDWMLFDQRYVYNVPKTVMIVHNFAEEGIVEIGGRFSSSLHEYLAMAEEGREYCLDTSHILQGVPEWEDLLTKLPEHTVKVVHLNLSPMDLLLLLIGRTPKAFSTLEKFHATVDPDVPVIVEMMPLVYVPFILFFLERIKTLIKVHFA